MTTQTRLTDRSRNIGVLMLIVAAVLWSMTGPAVKLVGDVPAVAFAMWRSLGAMLGAAAFILMRHGIRPTASGTAPPAGPMLLAALLFTANVTLLIYAMQQGTAARAILLQYTGPAWVALLGWLLLSRLISRRSAVALALAGLGVVIMLAGTTGNLLGSLYGVASGISYGALILALDWLDRFNLAQDKGPADPARVVLWMNLAAVVVLFPIAVATGTAGFDLGWPTLVFIIAFGVVQLAIPYALFQIALGRVGAMDAALIVLLEPVLSPIWTWLAVGERPDTATFIGGALLLCALVVEATKKRTRKAEG